MTLELAAQEKIKTMLRNVVVRPMLYSSSPEAFEDVSWTLMVLLVGDDEVRRLTDIFKTQHRLLSSMSVCGGVRSVLTQPGTSPSHLEEEQRGMVTTWVHFVMRAIHVGWD